MIIRIELFAGDRRSPRKKDMDKNIKALKKAEKGEPLNPVEKLLISDSISILAGIRRELA